MASIINNNNKDDESKGEDIMNNHADVLVLDPIIVQEMSEMNIVNDDPSFIDILPSGGAGRNIVYTILSMLDMKSVRSLIYSSFIQLFCKNRNDDTLYQLCKDIQHPFKIQLANELKITYEEEFPRGTPIVVACEKGRFEDVKLLITGRNNDVNGSNGNNNNNMTLKEYVNQEGKDSGGYKYTPLMIAAQNGHFQVVKYLIEQGEADPNIANSDGFNALHLAALNNEKDTKVIELLLTNMSLNSINKKDGGGTTPLDQAYYNISPIKQKIIDLIRRKGGKRA
jgi:ankyrin repeat protein